MAKRRKTNKWMQKAVRKPGAFTEYCRRLGYKGVTKDCIERAKRSKNPTTRRRAVLAETFRKVNRRRKRGRRGKKKK